MPYTLKTQQIAVKDPDTGAYVGVDILAEQTKEGLLNEINVLASSKKNEITQLGDEKKQAITSEATSQLSAITKLGDEKKQAITSEGIAQVQAINSTGQEVLASIPHEYTTTSYAVDAILHGGFIYNAAAGNVANFNDGADGMLIKSLVANINSVQDLHGYNSPWPAGSGKNKFDEVYDNISTTSTTTVTYKAIYVGDGDYTLSTTAPLNTGETANLFIMPGNVSTGASSATNGVSIGNTKTVTASDGYVTIGYRNYLGVNPKDYKTQLESGSTATDYTPYENYCPITGRTGLTLFHSGADTSDPDTISVNWQTEAGMVYGGSIDVITGKLIITHIIYVMDGIGSRTNGLSFGKGSSTTRHEYFTLATNSTLLVNAGYVRSNVICSHYTTGNPNYDLPVAFIGSGQLRIALPLTDERSSAELMNAWAAEQYNAGTPLCFLAKLASPRRIDLTPQQVTCLAGVNNIWADTGDVTVTYPVDTKTYIDKKIQEAIDGLSGS